MKGDTVELEAADGHRLAAYRSVPDGDAKGGIVVAQEIFGVNGHIRSICDRVADLGYVGLAPALFDRVESGFESGYSPSEIARARSFIDRLSLESMLADLAAGADFLRGDGRPVGIVGFCLGGSLAFMAGQQLSGLSCAVGYYGGRIAALCETAPACPTQLHFGALDASIPLTDVARIEAARPECDIHLYAGGDHGFHCDQRQSYHAPSAARAWSRTVDFLRRHMR